MIKINEDNYLEIYNVVPIYRGSRIIKFITSVSIKDIIDVYDKLEYDLNTQRGERVKKGKKSISKERIVNRSNIEEMKAKIREDFFDGGNLFWNVRIRNVGEEKEVIDFYPEENKIVIKANKITLPDSYQRHTAIFGLKDYKLSLNQNEYCFPLNICLYTFAEEQNLFSEINGEGTKASRTRSLFLSNAFKSIIVKEIIRGSALKNNVETTTDTIFRKNKSVSFSALYNSLFDKRVGAYKDLKEEDVKDFESWMIRFYDHLVDVRPELGILDDKERTEKFYTCFTTASISWTTFAIVSRLLRGESNWKRKLSRLNQPYKIGTWQGDIFSLENPLWHGTICTQNKEGGRWILNNNRRSQEFLSDIIKKYLNLV